MDWILLLAVAVGLLLAALVVFVDGAFEALFGRLLRALGFREGEGPLEAWTLDPTDPHTLELRNRGPDRIRLAAVQGRGSAGPCFPIPRLEPGADRATSPEAELRRAFSELVLEPGEVRTVFLDPAELRAMGCRELAILDRSGRVWPVRGIEPDESR